MSIMLKTILTKRTQKIANSSIRTQLSEHCDEELITYPRIKALEKDKRYCLTKEAFFLIGSEGAKIAYIKEDGSLSKQTSNAIGATSKAVDGSTVERTYQIVVPRNQTVYVYGLVDVVYKATGSDEDFIWENEVRIYVLLKKNYEGKISSYVKYSNKKLTMKYDHWRIFNPNNATISIKNESDSKTYESGDYGDIFKLPKEFTESKKLAEGEWTAEVKITIKGKDGIKLPEKFFELKPDTIYTTSSPDATISDYTKSGEDKLNAGAIVGIVLAIVIVCCFAGFCVYWFIFRDKKSYKEFPEV